MLPDRVSNPGPLTYESGALPIAFLLEWPIFEEGDIFLITVLFKVHNSMSYLVSSV